MRHTSLAPVDRRSSVPSSAPGSKRPIATLLRSGLVLAAALGVATTASAGDRTDQRGYQKCVQAMNAQNLSGVTFPRVYYISRQDTSNVYYVNATAWENGVRVGKRLTCETSKSGRTLLTAEANDGQFALSASSSAQVAKR